MGDQHHMDKFASYRATLFLTHYTWFLTLRAWLAMIPAQAASNAMRKIQPEGCFHDDQSTYIFGRGIQPRALARIRGGGAAGARGV
jgi:hypothetical protein